LTLAGPKEMHYLLPARMQELCDQAPMATPPKRLRAKEAGSRLLQVVHEAGVCTVVDVRRFPGYAPRSPSRLFDGVIWSGARLR
jgi:hypothetical protein